MEGKDRECLEKVFAEKFIECETLKKRVINVENDNPLISKLRVDAQECLLKSQLSTNEKESLLAVIRKQLEEIDNIKTKLLSSENLTQKLSESQKENEELKQKVCSLEKQVEDFKKSFEVENKMQTGNDMSNDVKILLTKQIDELTTNHQVYQKQIDIINNQKSSLTIEFETTKFKIKKLEARIIELESELNESAIQKEEDHNKNNIEKGVRILPNLSSSDVAKKIIITEL